MNSSYLALEVVSGVASAIGVILSVPVTTILGAVLFSQKSNKKHKKDNWELFEVNLVRKMGCDSSDCHTPLKNVLIYCNPIGKPTGLCDRPETHLVFSIISTKVPSSFFGARGDLGPSLNSSSGDRGGGSNRCNTKNQSQRNQKRCKKFFHVYLFPSM